MRFRQQIGLDRLRHTMEDQSHADGSNKKADDARRGIDAVWADIEREGRMCVRDFSALVE